MQARLERAVLASALVALAGCGHSVTEVHVFPCAARVVERPGSEVATVVQRASTWGVEGHVTQVVAMVVPSRCASSAPLRADCERLAGRWEPDVGCIFGAGSMGVAP